MHGMRENMHCAKINTIEYQDMFLQYTSVTPIYVLILITQIVTNTGLSQKAPRITLINLDRVERSGGDQGAVEEMGSPDWSLCWFPLTDHSVTNNIK